MTIEVTIGVDIGTTAVKALAVREDGEVMARHRIPCHLRSRHPGELAHDARADWRYGVRTALSGVSRPGFDVRGVAVAAMVPSLCAVDEGGRPVSDGILYGDTRSGTPEGAADPATSGELVRHLRWLADTHPGAAGYWPAQAAANHALAGVGAIDTTVAFTACPLFDYRGWDPGVAARTGVEDVSRLPRIVPGAEPVGEVGAAGGAPLGPGTVDALAAQMVAGADHDGDVLVILGATLIVWAVVPEWITADGLWTVPHTVPGKTLVGGASNAGGLFVSWATGLLGSPANGGHVDPARVPVWQPYPRGERVPLHDPHRLASLHDLDRGHDAAAVRRAAHEATGFAVRHILERSGASPKRIVATGGGVRDRSWVQAVADTTGLPVDVAAVAEGGALGAAWLARVTAGLEKLGAPADRWSRTVRRVEPDARYAGPAAERYARYRHLAEATG